jgi:alkanesulfonate monooxygenase SsuD/methylene tetrahydromethanopterin reductase-like flavin-dependent oxidoreductase (luciferase family)
MTRRQGIEAALAAWRDAERRLTGRVGDPDQVRREIAKHRREFQRRCAQEVVVPMDHAAHVAEAAVSIAVG